MEEEAEGEIPLLKLILIQLQTIAKRENLAKKEYYPEEINGFAEITSLNGNITEMGGKPYIHLHATLADQHHAIHGGHVLEMRVGATCEMFVSVLEGEVTRQIDEGLGINLWTF